MTAPLRTDPAPDNGDLDKRLTRTILPPQIIPPQIIPPQIIPPQIIPPRIAVSTRPAFLDASVGAGLLAAARLVFLFPRRQPPDAPLHQQFQINRAALIPIKTKLKRVLQIVQAKVLRASGVRTIQKRAMFNLR
jgi:hypothetical protein